jgi:hypothetical protein
MLYVADRTPEREDVVFTLANTEGADEFPQSLPRHQQPRSHPSTRVFIYRRSWYDNPSMTHEAFPRRLVHFPWYTPQRLLLAGLHRL